MRPYANENDCSELPVMHLVIYPSIHLLLEQAFIQRLLSAKHLAGPSVIAGACAMLQACNIVALEYTNFLKQIMNILGQKWMAWVAHLWCCLPVANALSMGKQVNFPANVFTVFAGSMKGRFHSINSTFRGIRLSGGIWILELNKKRHLSIAGHLTFV